MYIEFIEKSKKIYNAKRLPKPKPTLRLFSVARYLNVVFKKLQVTDLQQESRHEEDRIDQTNSL